MALLTKDAILRTDPRSYIVIDVPEWGGEARLRSMTGRERDAFEASLTTTRGNKQKPNLDNFRARMVAQCLCDEKGDLLFRNRVEVAALGDLNVGGLQRLYNACQELNGMSDEDVEDLTEDFDDPTPVELSTSA